MNFSERFRAKLDRAGELLTTIENEIRAYHASEPYAYQVVRSGNPPSLELVVDSVRPPPLRLGVLLGEFIHDLRSTLDHVVWHLARTRVTTPHRRLQFPIYVEPPDDWDQVVRDRLRDVPNDAVGRIWEVQPFHADRPSHQALAVVHALSNEDKHHLILDSVSVPAEPDESHFEVQTFDINEDVHIEAMWGAPLRPGMTLLTVRYTPTGPHPKIDVAARAPAEVSFGEMGFRAAAMPGVAGEIVRCVRSFEPFFA